MSAHPSGPAGRSPGVTGRRRCAAMRAVFAFRVAERPPRLIDRLALLDRPPRHREAARVATGPESYGPEIYGPECAAARESTGAAAALLIILGGDRGSGFAIQTASPAIADGLPAMLRGLAAMIEVERAELSS